MLSLETTRLCKDKVGIHTRGTGMRKKEGPERCGVHHSSPCAQGEYLVLLLLALHDRGNPRNMPGEDNFEVFDPRSWPVRPFSAVTFSVCLLCLPSEKPLCAVQKATGSLGGQLHFARRRDTNNGPIAKGVAACNVVGIARP